MWPFRKRAVAPAKAAPPSPAPQHQTLAALELPPGWAILHYKAYYLPCNLAPVGPYDRNHPITLYPLLNRDHSLVAFVTLGAASRYCLRHEKEQAHGGHS